MDLKQFRDENLEWHLGQAKCYAFLFAKERNLKSISIKLTYIKQGNTSEKLFDNYIFFYEELEQFVYSLIEEYIEFYNVIFRKDEIKNASIEKLEFPFDNYRKGQRNLARYAYATAVNGGNLFVEAPTVIVKTMSTLFHFIKAIRDD